MNLPDLKETATEQLTANYAAYFSAENAKDILALIEFYEQNCWIPVSDPPKQARQELALALYPEACEAIDREVCKDAP